MTFHTYTKTLITTLAAIAVIGCGGGNELNTNPIVDGEPDGPSTEAPPEGAVEGRLTGNVSGVEYETDTIQGFTNGEGGFFYEPGQVVRFWIGDAYLGAAAGDSLISPFELSGIAPITNGLRGLRQHRLEVAQVGNVLTFLETFDSDGDPENGIEISEEVHGLFESVDVNFRQRAKGFRHDPDFRRGLNEANASGLFEDYRTPRAPTAAMERLYDELGIESRILASRLAERDNGADGTVDRVTYDYFSVEGFHVEQYEGVPGVMYFEWRRSVDAWGHPISSTSEDLLAGRVDSIRNEIVDRNGRVVRVETDRGGDGTLDHIRSYEVDGFGRYTAIYEDWDADGTPESLETFAYDDDRRTSTRTVDRSHDGVTDDVSVIYYNEVGDIIRTEIDAAPMGSVDEIVTYRYDAHGRIVETREDFGADGTAEYSEWTEYSDEGLVIRYTADGNGDGAVDFERVFESVYHEGLEHRYEIVDTNFDGSPDYVRINVRDEDGFTLREIYNHAADITYDDITEHSPTPVGWGYFFESESRMELRPF